MPPSKKQRSGVSPFQTSIRWKPDSSRDASKPVKLRGDRRRLVIGTEFDGYGVECLKSEAEAIVHQHCDYEVLTRFTKRSDRHTEPTVTDIVSRMEDEFDEANAMIEKFIGDLKKKKAALRSSMDDMLKMIGKRNKWWEETDIFAHGKHLAGKSNTHLKKRIWPIRCTGGAREQDLPSVPASRLRGLWKLSHQLQEINEINGLRRA